MFMLYRYVFDDILVGVGALLSYGDDVDEVRK